MDLTNFLPILIVPTFFVVFTTMWCTIVYIIAVLGGWRQLATYYQTDQPFTGQTWSFQGGYMGWSRYSGVLTTGANATHLYLSVLIFYRPGHPPLLIPWNDITTEEATRFFFIPVVTFRFKQTPDVTLQLINRNAQRLLALRTP
ncbi:MAG TPA: hypothetical protein VLL52_25525 [Anaerolineae bacterium]|nr:hypothetical protein [Anaerolineae bacterium]